ncbi:MAG: aromatic amino acid lyase, partial [Pirellulaceae bacterium]
MMTKIRVSHLYEDLTASMAHLQGNSAKVTRSRAVVEQALNDNLPHYGINTGFGALSDKRIPNDELSRLQRNILLSHACGVGDPVPQEITALMLKLKIHSLGIGQSGISEKTFALLLAMDQHALVPWVPSKGSVGASGDLAPLAHLCLPLIGRGEIWSADGSIKQPADSRLAEAGLEPIELQAKDGLALINGTQLMSAYGAHILNRAMGLLKEVDILAAMSLEALQGSAVPFDERIHLLRPHRGQQDVAANVRNLLAGSEILASHRDCGKVQDPYCLRCVPQVHGASRDALAYATSVIETELNSVTDNPLV